MTSQQAVDEFLAQRNLAIVGVSRGGKKFGNTIYKELRAKGYHVIPINPHTATIEDDLCYPSVAAVPESVDGVVIVVPPEETDKIVREADAVGIRRIWMQQGAESETAIQFCEEREMTVIHGECILMFAEPVAWYHKPHRWIWSLLGKLPR